MKNKTTSWYSVKIKGKSCSFTPSGYSQYFPRLSQKDKGKLRGAVYGIEQAKAHIAELRKHRYNGKLIYKDAIFEIVRETRIERIVKTVSPGN
jgi:hypothetical protein